MNYITAEELLNNVKEKLYQLYTANKIDDSIIYNRLNKLGSRFRLNQYPVKNTVLEVKNYCSSLPEDFHKAILLYGCFEYTLETSIPQQLTLDVTDNRECVYIDGDASVDLFRVIHKLDTQNRVYTQFDLLSLTKDSYSNCFEGILNGKSRSNNRVDIKNGNLITEFEEGLVYIEYITKLEGKDLMFPKHDRVTEWLEKEIVAEIFHYLYLNSEGDYQQRMMLTKQEASIAELSARSIIKTQEFDEMYKVTKVLTNRYNRIRINVWDDDKVYYPIKRVPLNKYGWHRR